MSVSSRAEFAIPGGLLALSLIPVLAGASRVHQLANGTETTPENARFIAMPLPVVLHIVSSTVYAVLGAFQFAPAFRRRHPIWHRAVGRGLLAGGFLAALSALWMTQAFPLGSLAGPLPADYDGRGLYLIRWVVGSTMLLHLGLGVRAVHRRDFRAHGAWMIRAYALGLGAGTQAFTHIPWFVVPEIRGELTRFLCMTAGWLINAAVAEWLIARHARAVAPAGSRAVRSVAP